MLLNEPAPTDYDITFDLFGFEVRTNLLFFVLPVFIGQGFVSSFQKVNPGVGMLIVAAVFWVSILVHELGHAFAFRMFGIHSRIVLYLMGGLAIPEGLHRWSSAKKGRLTPVQQIIVSLAGPVAGLMLAAALCLIVWSLKGSFATSSWKIIPLPMFGETSPITQESELHLAFSIGVVINIVLNLFNLVPVFPLDGGQVTRQLLVLKDPWNGIRQSLILSIVACLGMILLTLQMGFFLPVFFGLMAYSNFQELQGPRW